MNKHNSLLGGQEWEFPIAHFIHIIANSSKARFGESNSPNGIPVRKRCHEVVKVGDVVPNEGSIGDQGPIRHVKLEFGVGGVSERHGKVALD